MDREAIGPVQKVYTRRIEAAEQGSYIEVPFDMVPEAERLHVSISVGTAQGRTAVIDLGVRDAVRLRGWSGGARREFQIGRERATPGYTPGPLDAGGWAVLLGAYRVPQEGCDVSVSITIERERPRWLKGDLHMHSVHSDGSYTLEENAAIMAELGCDFLAMTDHNTTSQNAAYPRDAAVVMIPGMEFTTNFGHSNMLGVEVPIDDFRSVDQAGVNDKLRTARERGAMIVLNHPHCDYCPWEWEFSDDFGIVEIWNGPWHEANRRTLDWWDEQLRKGRRIVAVGGSDMHRPDPYRKHAHPTTWVYGRSRTVDGILEGIDAGHVVLSWAPDGPFVSLACGDRIVGDAVADDSGRPPVILTAERLREGDAIRLISDRGVERDITVSAADGGSAVLEWHERGRQYIRAEIWRKFEEVDRVLLAAVTNPIYFEPQEG
ncbi:phosphoesterase [Paenibacillus sp. 32O-W]|uniref:CehA/McbA family metallohydrolase n=1 Tax=Paenibacillus sp. 32O-W TaxID=1695218 RepID=UPI0007226BC7|nr:CehA/McbA family metallohydrolase [Paenibacillus sp. 32O-W]ALS27646.1 phosphoesterase [Paenibacillus sp. 32O-W]